MLQCVVTEHILADEFSKLAKELNLVGDNGEVCKIEDEHEDEDEHHEDEDEHHEEEDHDEGWMFFLAAKINRWLHLLYILFV